MFTCSTNIKGNMNKHLNANEQSPMNTGIVYFIQPNLVVGVNRYKIGYSAQYGIVFELVNPADLERVLLSEFRNAFKLISGKEYFEGDEVEMRILFLQLCTQWMRDNQMLTPAHQKPGFEPVVDTDDKRVKCLKCTKSITIKHFARHRSVCKGVPKNTCKYCRMVFRYRSGKCRHQKTCKLNPVNMPPPPPQQPSPTLNEQTINKKDHDKNYNITFNFGDENVEYLVTNREQDPRITPALQNFGDVLRLVYFNKGHRENQTVRKLVKKDNTMDILVNNRWQPECCLTYIPKMRQSLSTMLKSPTLSDLKSITDKSCREILYACTKDGEIDENDVLEKFNVDTHEHAS